jgi:hypothetical protein
LEYLGLSCFIGPPRTIEPSMSDAEQSQDLHTHQPNGAQSVNFTPPVEGRLQRGRRAKTQRGQDQSDNWSELQELRDRLAEHEETMERLKSVFGMISCVLKGTGTHLDSLGTNLQMTGRYHWMHGNNETPSSRPPRLDRRGGVNGNTSHYKNNNRGGVSGGYRGVKGGAQGFRGG